MSSRNAFVLTLLLAASFRLAAADREQAVKVIETSTAVYWQAPNSNVVSFFPKLELEFAHQPEIPNARSAVTMITLKMMEPDAEIVERTIPEWSGLTFNGAGLTATRDCTYNRSVALVRTARSVAGAIRGRTILGRSGTFVCDLTVSYPLGRQAEMEAAFREAMAARNVFQPVFELELYKVAKREILNFRDLNQGLAPRIGGDELDADLAVFFLGFAVSAGEATRSNWMSVSPEDRPRFVEEGLAHVFEPRGNRYALNPNPAPHSFEVEESHGQDFAF